MTSAVTGTAERPAVEGAPETAAVTAGEAPEVDDTESVVEKEKEQA
jgi:hypothetical protein